MQAFIVAIGVVCFIGFGTSENEIKGQRVDIVLSARDVAKMDSLSQSDPFVKVFYKFDTNQNWISYGQTGVAQDNPNPNWPESFTFDFAGGNAQHVKYEIWDNDVEYHDLIGEMQLVLGDVVSSAVQGGGMNVERAIPQGRGRLQMKVRIDGVIPQPAKSDAAPGPVLKALGAH